MKLSKWITAALVAISVTWAEPTTPLEDIKKNDAELQALIKANKAEASPENIERMKFLINSIFDFSEMGRRALGSSTWKEQDSLKQQEFVAAFKAMVENASVKKLEVYESERTEYDEADFSGKKAKLTAHVFSKGEETILVYKMKKTDDSWKAWDLVINDLSTMRNYREQFKSILKDKSFDELVKILQDKASE